MKVKLDENLPAPWARSSSPTTTRLIRSSPRTWAATPTPRWQQPLWPRPAAHHSRQRVWRHPDPPARNIPGILVLRLADESAVAVRQAMTELLAHHRLEDLAGAATVFHHGRLRIVFPERLGAFPGVASVRPAAQIAGICAWSPTDLDSEQCPDMSVPVCGYAPLRTGRGRSRFGLRTRTRVVARSGSSGTPDLGGTDQSCVTRSTEISTAVLVPLFSSQCLVFLSSGQPTPGP